MRSTCDHEDAHHSNKRARSTRRVASNTKRAIIMNRQATTSQTLGRKIKGTRNDQQKRSMRSVGGKDWASVKCVNVIFYLFNTSSLAADGPQLQERHKNTDDFSGTFLVQPQARSNLNAIGWAHGAW